MTDIDRYDDEIPFPKPADFPGHLVAYASPATKEAWVEIIDVGGLLSDPSKRFQGHGSRVIRQFEAWAKAHGATLVEHHVFNDAIGFWQKMGYTVSDEPVYRDRRNARKQL